MEYRRRPEVKKKSRLWISILIVVLIFMGVAAMILNSVFIVKGYKQFYADLSDSVRYATQNDCLRTEYNGEVTRINEENAYNIVQFINRCGYKNHKDDHEANDVISFDFGNGDRMWVSSLDEFTIIIRYVYSDGREKVYVSTEPARLFDLSLFLKTSRGNTPWE